MVAYSFKSSFAAPILSGVKRQTIRSPRKRHAREGEALQLFTGMRTKACRRLGVATCSAVSEVRLDFSHNEITLNDAVVFAGQDLLDDFAVSDGFAVPERFAEQFTPWRYMARWWRLTHGDINVFRGVLITWSDTFVAESAS